jgi:hypothetical protein
MTFAFRAALSRPPDDRQLSELTGLYNRRLQHFRAVPRMAEALVKGGDHSLEGDGRPQTESAEILAAWTLVANVILNLDEWVTRE